MSIPEHYRIKDAQVGRRLRRQMIEVETISDNV